MMVQPIASIADGSCDRFEVLLRMRSADGQLIQPSGFLPAAERFGLIRSIDQWVITHAIDLLCKVQKTKPNTKFAINLSAKSLDDDSMYKVITSALQQSKVNPKSITFEITENTAISNLNSSIDFLQRLRALGCRTALDDFGVGYSSFAYLKDLPVDFVKIDGSFVRNIEVDNLQYTMVRAMNDVAHAMGKYTVAEYVDSRQSLEHLIDIGVDYAQGFYIGKPKVLLVESSPSTNLVSA
jgi:EAL domain-containing protein (putative c-di-GMP-specific phosphodiesterase class I)